MNTTKKSQIIKAAYESNLMQQIEVILYDNLHQGQYDTDLPIYGVLESAEKILEWHDTLATEVRKQTIKEYDEKVNEVINRYMKHHGDGIYEFKEYSGDVFLANNIKNDLKNIGWRLEQLQSQGEK